MAVYWKKCSPAGSAPSGQAAGTNFTSIRTRSPGLDIDSYGFGTYFGFGGFTAAMFCPRMKRYKPVTERLYPVCVSLTHKMPSPSDGFSAPAALTAAASSAVCAAGCPCGRRESSRRDPIPPVVPPPPPVNVLPVRLVLPRRFARPVFFSVLQKRLAELHILCYARHSGELLMPGWLVT
jgi:hypothetical protein